MGNQLVIEELPDADCWRDLARVPHKYRVGHNKVGNEFGIHRGQICKITVNGHSKLLTVRGCDLDKPVILLELSTRLYFKVKLNENHEVTLKPVGWWGYLQWAWSAADPIFRIPTQLSIISFILGIISFILGIVLPILAHYHIF